MHDICTESVVRVSPRPIEKVIRVFLILVGVALLFLTFLYGLIFAIALIAVVYLLVRHFGGQAKEYEYIHCNETFEVDMVIGNARRKHLLTVNLGQVLLVAPEDAPELLRFGNAQESNYAGDPNETAVYTMVYSENGRQKKLRLRLEPKMYQSLRKWLPSRIL